MGLFKKSGGGFLNGENGVIEALTFDSKVWGEGEKAYTSLSAEVSILRDGADEPVSQFLAAGFLHEGQSVSEDGTLLEATDDASPYIVADDSEFGRFVQSAVESGVAEDSMTSLDFTALVGARYTFAKELNRERQMAAGKKKLGKAKAATANDEDILKAGRQQDKTDKTKFYNHMRLIVGAVLGVAEAKPKAAKTAPRSSAAKNGKANGAAKTVEKEVDETEAEGVLLSILADAKDNTVTKSSLSGLIVRKSLADGIDNNTREAYRKLIGSNEFLAREAGWSFDADAKGSPISLA